MNDECGLTDGGLGFRVGFGGWDKPQTLTSKPKQTLETLKTLASKRKQQTLETLASRREQNPRNPSV